MKICHTHKSICSVVKLSILSKLIHKFNIIPIKLQVDVFVDINNADLIDL